MKRVIETLSTHMAVNCQLVGLTGRDCDPRDAGGRPGHGQAYRKWRKRRAAGQAK